MECCDQNTLDLLVLRVMRELARASTFRIIAFAVIWHSILSIMLIYYHLGYYQESYLSKHASLHSHPNRGKIAIYSKPLTTNDVDSELRYKLTKISYEDKKIFGPLSINLLHSKLIPCKELTHVGWFSDHFRWEEKVQCFNNRWTLCDKIYIAKCRQDTIRAIYQYVPFKPQAKVRHLYFSLRATADQLVEQSNDAFYGMMALIEFDDGTNELLKLKFQYESEAWSLRSHYFEVLKKTIRSVTVMIACFGYSGVASFTDIRLNSLEAGIDPKLSLNSIASWCYKDSDSNRQKIDNSLSSLDYEILKLPVDNQHDKINYRKKNLLTFVTQVSMDRLNILERSLQTWSGPISVAIYIPIKDMAQGIQDWQRLYINKKITSLNISFAESSVLLIASPNPESYPINRLRNLAIRMVKTKFMFLIDVDFQPSPGLEVNFVEILNKNYQQNNLTKIAFVVPAFEYLEMPNKEDPILTSKDELIQLIYRDDPMIQPFRLHESTEAHGLTNYWKWYYSFEPYNISAKFHDKYEPYIIVEKSDNFPLYYESLINYGMNKVMHTTELFAANYTFQVLSNAWAIHFPHRSTSYYTDFLQNLEQRLLNRAQRFYLLEHIIQRYQIKLPDCT